MKFVSRCLCCRQQNQSNRLHALLPVTSAQPPDIAGRCCAAALDWDASAEGHERADGNDHASSSELPQAGSLIRTYSPH